MEGQNKLGIVEVFNGWFFICMNTGLDIVAEG